MDCGAVSEATGTSKLTVEIMFKLLELDYHRLIGKYNYGADGEWILYPFNDGTVYFFVGDGSKVEGIELSPEALDYLTQLGVKNSLRYAIQLLAPAGIVAKEEKSEVIKKEHVERVEKLFADVKKSVRYLKEYEKQFLEF